MFATSGLNRVDTSHRRGAQRGRALVPCRRGVRPGLGKDAADTPTFAILGATPTRCAAAASPCAYAIEDLRRNEPRRLIPSGAPNRLLDAAYQDKRIEVPWWGGRTLSYSFPAR